MIIQLVVCYLVLFMEKKKYDLILVDCPWEYDNNTMVTICKNCHEIYHGLKKEFGCFGKYKLQVHCTMDYADDYNYFVIYHSNLYVAIKVNAEEPNYSFKFYHCVELPLLRGLIHFLQENDTWH